ncbi:hypothetical protein E4H12_07845 [Candidatus Thorarchaeota archaeon]|nr:hypothetical protein [Candidatus Thorarchaeota archaeon]TFG97757.1 MAG: hypothetical protein E4H12_07845 [Candidatus Thorarchaeota archaeon]
MSNDPKNVKVHIALEGGEKGHILVDKRGISIVLDTGRSYARDSLMEIVYSSDYEIVPTTTEGISRYIPQERKDRISLNPQAIQIRPFAPYIGQVVEDIYPPSTHGFYGRMKQGHKESIYIIQDIIDNPMKWLTIGNPESGVVYESHMIKPYEAEALRLFDHAYTQRLLYRDISREKNDSKKQIMEKLESSSPSWDEISRIVTDVSFPNLSLKDSTHDTLSQLVPDSFPEMVREQLIAFLSFVTMNEIPDIDPVDLNFGLLSVPLLGSLIRGHIRCMVDGVVWPPYVKLMALAARGQLGAPKRAVSDDLKDIPWMLFWQKCAELFPNWLYYSIKSANELNETNRIFVGLPITKSAAKRNKIAWKKRFASSIYDFRILGRVNTKSLGLTELVYLGAAYRWPHRHMKFITRLGTTIENSQHLQVMTVPSTAAERIIRVLPGVIKIGRSVRMSNLDMFDNSSKSWGVPAKPIIDSIGRTSSERKLLQLVGSQKIAGLQSITTQEAKVLDLLTTGINLEDMEIQDIMDYFELDNKILKSTIKDLVQRNIVDISYETFDDQLISLATIIQGKQELLRSIAIAFLNNTPSSLAMLNDVHDQAILLSRLPESTAYDLASSLPERGFDLGLNIRCMRPTIFQSYTHNLYQRLLKEDGTWDDDVSAFLFQARSKRKEMSESNA